MSIDTSYRQTYQPLITSFCASIDASMPGLDKIPAPFLPYFGPNYDKAHRRILYMGIDTRGWGEKDNPGVKGFIDRQKTNPESWLKTLHWLQTDLGFRNWGGHRYTFFGFIMNMMADLNGIDDWAVVKRGDRNDLLSSFAWSNEHAIENFPSSAKKAGADHATWQVVREQSLPLANGTRLLSVLKPHIVVVLNGKIDVFRHFSGVKINLIKKKDGASHFMVEEQDIHVFQVPHPNRMRWSGCGKVFRDTLFTWLRDAAGPQLTTRTFFAEKQTQAIAQLIENIPTTLRGNRVEVVANVAKQLSQRNSIMSVPALCRLLAQINVRTTYGSSYAGGRGTYRMISKSIYERLVKLGRPEEADMVAKSFVTPDGCYAYTRNTPTGYGLGPIPHDA